MDNYSLRYTAAPQAGIVTPGEKTVTFYAHSTGNALELAKEAAGGDRAELFRNGKSVCRMKLVGETGVWLVQRSHEPGDDGADGRRAA